MDEYSIEQFEKAHARSIYNRPLVEASTLCGCFCCLRVFDPTKVEFFKEDRVFGSRNLETHETAVCPHCGVDSVIDNMSGFPLDEKFLTLMAKRYFNPQ